MPQSNPTPPLGFPDPVLIVPYGECLNYVQYRLKTFGHGELKPFCAEHDLSYNTVVNLKNGTSKREEPRAMLRLLAALDVKTKLYRVPDSHEQNAFLFPNKKELETFRNQLKYFNDLVKA